MLRGSLLWSEVPRNMLLHTQVASKPGSITPVHLLPLAKLLWRLVYACSNAGHTNTGRRARDSLQLNAVGAQINGMGSAAVMNEQT